jgi:phosphoglycerol transferase MdoB-like AlkP superfamily enzyme
MYKQLFINHFVTVIVITTLFILALFGFMAYFVGLDQALDNIGGWYETREGGEVYYHAYNFLHFSAVTFLPAMLFAPLMTLTDWLNAPKKRRRTNTNTITNKTLTDIKL